MGVKKTALIATCAGLVAGSAGAEERVPQTQLYFGDTHVHSNYSFDAFMNGNRDATPDVAYRWAKGQPVIHPGYGARVQLDRPLDFLVVADHAENLGVYPAVYYDRDLKDLDLGGRIGRWIATWILKRSIDDADFRKSLVGLIPEMPEGFTGDPVPLTPEATHPYGPTDHIRKAAWADIAETADRHNVPGEFSAIIGWEWSSIPLSANLHRVVLSSSSGEEAKQYLPFSFHDSQYPQDLWDWLDKTEQEAGVEFLAIPHNSNISKGYMFDETTLKGEAITATYANWRMRWEPVIEVTQFKGDSETHPQLSPDDPFADFERYEFYIQAGTPNYQAAVGDYARSALRRGLEIENRVGANPYQFGMIGSTDAHTGLSSAGEDNFQGKMADDAIPETKFTDNSGTGPTGWDMAASGLAAVWAMDNTRQAIFNAFKRREVYATTGPRMKLRVFGGFEFADDAAGANDIATVGYRAGVPMGGNLVLPDQDKPLQLLIRAVKDAAGANLDRVQVIKGWVNAEGNSQEKVFDVAKASSDAGVAALSVLWADPDFDPDLSAFYYVRVLQVPTPRHSSYDMQALGWDENPNGKTHPRLIQERAYSSPIWYAP